MTEAEIRLGQKAEVPTPWAYRGMESSEGEIWVAVTGCRVAKDDSGGIQAVWADRVLHCRCGRPGRKPSLWKDVREDADRQIAGWMYTPLRQRLKALKTHQIELVLGGGNFDAAIVFSDEVVLAASWGPEGKRNSANCFILGSDILANVSRLSRQERRGKSHHGPRKEAAAPAAAAPAPTPAPEPVAVKVTAAEKGWAPEGGRKIPVTLSLPPAGTTMALPAPAPVEEPAPAKPAAKKRATPTAKRAAKKPSLASVGAPAEDAEASDAERFPELSHFSTMSGEETQD